MPRNPNQHRRQGSLNWRTNEIEILLGELETSLPLGQNEWETCLGRINDLLDPSRKRDINSIRNKFKALRIVQKLTGDPSLPEVNRYD